MVSGDHGRNGEAALQLVMEEASIEKESVIIHNRHMVVSSVREMLEIK